ncbi:MAG: zinc-binding dehydrogenase [Dehalococcoidia bacterium]|nr:zinc-binding dehydrogenase [Dehalococcoidia bacterium]
MINRDSIIGALDDGNGNYIPQDIPFPEIFEGSAIIDIKASGICGSDLHMTNERNQPQSIPSGHEIAGEILELPKSYYGSLNIGDRVAIDNIGAGKACGTCYFCNYGQFRHCMNQSPETGGGFSQFITRKPKGLFKISDEMDWNDGALVEPMAVSVHGFRFANFLPGENVAIVGSSTIGLSSIAVARAFGAKTIIASAKYDHQAKAAKNMGADIVVSSEPGELENECFERTNGVGVDVVVETIGGTSNSPLVQAAQCVKNTGKVIVLGGFRNPVEVDFLQPMIKEISFIPATCYANINGKHDFEIAKDILSNGNHPYKKIVTHQYELEDIQEGFKTAYDKTSGSIKVHVMQ